MDNKDIGQKIKEEREKRKVYQKDLADYLQISKNYLGCIERGERNVTLELLIKISAYFNISLDYMVFENIHESSESTCELHKIIDKCSETEIKTISDVIKALLPNLRAIEIKD